jgi:hypothetical protein
MALSGQIVICGIKKKITDQTKSCIFTVQIICTKMMKSIENKGVTATDTLENEIAGKAQMPEVRRRVVINR